MSAIRRLSAALAASAAVALLAGLAPSAAFAHAQLEATSPVRGAVLERAPSAVVFRFSELVEGNFGAVRVFDAAGRRVDAGDAFHPGGRSSQLAVRLRGGLPDGTYTGTYRVVSADSHIVSGGIVFSIGAAGAAGRTVAELLAGSDAGAVTKLAFGLARTLQFGALAVALGALAFLLLVWRRALAEAAGADRIDEPWTGAAAAFARRLRVIVVAAALVGVLGGALGIVMQGAEAAGVGGFDALDPTIVRETLGTRFGTVWGIGVLAWIALAGIAWATLARGGRAGGGRAGGTWPDPAPAAWALVVPAAALLLLPGLSGHAASQSPVAVLLPANVLHVAAVSTWVGGLAVLLLVLPAATRRLPAPADRGRLLAAALVRFSALALVAVGAILASGILQSLLYLDRVGDLLDTGFGRAILVKAALLLALIGLGAYQRRRSVPRLRRIAAAGETPGRAGVLLRRALRAELALLVVVLGVTAALAASSPSSSAQVGPFDRTTALGPLQLQLTVDPAAVGANAVHLYLLNAQDGSQFTGARAVTVSATQRSKGIGPLRETPDPAGPGHYTLAAMPFGVAGDWDVRVTVRVSDFDQYETTVEVPIR